MTTLRRYTMVATLLGLTVAGLVLQPVASTAVASTEAPTPAPSFYVANGNHSLTAYAEGASGNASPVATISGPQTGLWSPKRIAIDEAGRILSYNGSDPGREIVHAPGASGNAAPIAATKPVSHSTVLDSLAVRDGYVYIADDFRNSVYKYAVGPTGEFTWVSALGGSSSTQIRRPHAIALDRLGYLYIANNDYPNASYSITKYAPGAKGNCSGGSTTRTRGRVTIVDLTSY